MTKATFEPLVPAWYSWLTRHYLGIVRVYLTNETKEPAKYKFFTVASIQRKRCHIIGLSHASITLKDLRAIAKCVKVYAVTELYWTHNNKLKIYKVNV